MSWVPGLCVSVSSGYGVSSVCGRCVAVSVRPGVVCELSVSAAADAAEWRSVAAGFGYVNPDTVVIRHSASVVSLGGWAALRWPVFYGALSSVVVSPSFCVSDIGVSFSVSADLSIGAAGLALSSVLTAVSLAVDPYAVRPDQRALILSERFTSFDAVVSFDDGQYVPAPLISWGGEDLTKRAAVPVRSAVSALQSQAEARRGVSGFGWLAPNHQAAAAGVGYLLGVVIPGDYPAPDIRAVHIIVNSVNCFRLSDSLPLALADVQIALDLDSVSWRFSAVALNAATAAALRPGSAGRQELAVVINGHRWEFFVSKSVESRAVDGNSLSRRWQITGYSRAQYLSEPYAPRRTGSVGAITAVQAAASELSGSGFGLVWDVSALPDWVMPDASFSYQSLTPLQVIRRLSAAAGGVVRPAMAADQIEVMPRFAVLPWNLLAADMDATIHESQILSESHEDQPGVLFNAVFVSGETVGGTLNVIRAGTAGDEPADDVSDRWITDVVCNASRGAQELAAAGDRVLHTLDLPLPESVAQPGLLRPGDLVLVQHDDSSNDYRGYVRSVSVSVPGRGGARVRQTVVIDQPVGLEVSSV